MSLVVQRRNALLDSRSVVIALLVLLLGAGIGFAVGYEVKAHRTTTSAKAKTPTKTASEGAKAKAAAPHKTAGPSYATPENITFLRTCLASHGLNYPAVSGASAFTAQISKPPAGVSQSTYESGLQACYVAMAGKK